MADEPEVAEQTTPEEKPKKPRKPRKPRAPKAEQPEKSTRKKKREEDEDERSEHVVEHADRTITLTGSNVTLRAMTPAEQKKHGIVSISGIIGAPCTSPTVITFKSRDAAFTFFDWALDESDEDREPIITDDDVEWYSDDLIEIF